ncbi:MAG: PorT family protein [Chitinophagales bacterium]|nr:PorT family protein [Chitinophagales bacterium]
MKKILFTFTLGLFSLTAFSQTNFRFGFTTSPGFSWYSVDSKLQKSEGAKFTFNYGAIMDLNIGTDERYAISTGLDINLEGGKLRGFSLDKTAESSITAKVQYLEIPIALKLRSNESAQNLTYYGSLGIINGFRIRARGKYAFQPDMVLGKSSIEESNIKIKDLPFYPSNIKKISPYQLSLHFEAGIEYRVSDNTSVIGGLYFRNGFTNIVKDSDDDRVVARGIGIRLGVMF